MRKCANKCNFYTGLEKSKFIASFAKKFHPVRLLLCNVIIAEPLFQLDTKKTLTIHRIFHFEILKSVSNFKGPNKHNDSKTNSIRYRFLVRSVRDDIVRLDIKTVGESPFFSIRDYASFSIREYTSFSIRYYASFSIRKRYFFSKSPGFESQWGQTEKKK